MKDKAQKILIITDAWTPQVNGVVRTYEYLKQELECLGHNVHVIGPSAFPMLMPMPLYPEVELSLFPSRRMARLIRSFSPDHIHIGTEGPLGWAARRWCLRNKVPFTTAYHTQFPDYTAQRTPVFKDLAWKFSDWTLRLFHGAAGAVIITTPSLEQELRGRGYTMMLHTMNRGVPVDLFTPGPSDLFAHLPKPVALYVGRVAVEKNLESFLGMAWPGAKVVVGDGPGLNMLREKFPDAVFTGKKTGAELVNHYRAADVFVFPSRTDTFGIVLIEALACGLPVAAFDVIGPRDIITEPHLGALHSHDLAAAAERALAGRKDAQARHDHVRRNYSWAAAARRFMEILEGAV